MAAKRDSGKASSETNVPARKAPKRQLVDKISRSDFGVLKARPSSPRKRTAASPGQLADSGVPDDIDLPSLFSTAGKKLR